MNKILKGQGVSKGVAEGYIVVTNKIILSSYPKPPFILVAKMTDPSFTPYILKSCGVITEIGGVGSHVAKICRELQKPCVTQVRGACKTMANWKLGIINGNNGTVIKIK